MGSKSAKAFGICVGAALVLWAVGPAAAEDILSKAVNDPSVGWSVYGALATSELIKDSAVAGGTAERVTLSGKGENPWDAGASSLVTKPVAAGDVLLLAFWARAQQLPTGADNIQISAKLQENAAPYVALGTDTPIHVSSQWKLYYAHGTAAKSYAPRTIAASLQLATAKQTIDFGPLFVLDFGPGYDVGTLPHN